MRKDQVHVGHTYVARISDKLTRVRIDGENAHGGWDATNLTTNKKVRIKSPAKLRGPAPERDAKQRAKAVAETQAADASINAHAVPAEAAAPAKQTRAKKVAAEPKTRKPSGLDAACEVLKARGEPMTCKAIVEEMLARGMWATGGKTPASTLHAAICREIQAKAGEARFKKTDRGQFTINAK